MKYYQLTKDLPTFNKGEIFYIDANGSLMSNKEPHVMAYAKSTLAKFPNILSEWFVETEKPVRDINTKTAFVLYLHEHPDERFFQAVRNFAARYLEDAVSHVYVSGKVSDTNLSSHPTLVDTFYWECDEMLKGENEL